MASLLLLCFIVILCLEHCETVFCFLRLLLLDFCFVLVLTMIKFVSVQQRSIAPEIIQKNMNWMNSLFFLWWSCVAMWRTSIVWIIWRCMNGTFFAMKWKWAVFSGNWSQMLTTKRWNQGNWWRLNQIWMFLRQIEMQSACWWEWSFYSNWNHSKKKDDFGVCCLKLMILLDVAISMDFWINIYLLTIKRAENANSESFRFGRKPKRNKFTKINRSRLKKWI